MATTIGLLLVLLVVTTYHHVTPMCASDMIGRVCKDMMLPPEMSNCINSTDDNWPCQLPTTSTSRSTGHDKKARNTWIDFLENELREEPTGGGGGRVLEVSGVVGGQVTQIRGCEGGAESPTIYPQGAIQGVPYVKYGHADQNAEYLLMMVDPDAPSNPQYCDKARYFCTYLHWVVSHIPGENLLKPSRLTNGETLQLSFRQPTPPSDVHRYQILLFEMHQDVQDLPDDLHRDSFDLNYFIGGNNLCDKLRATFQYRVEHVAR